MSICKNSIFTSDVSTVPIKVKYSQSLFAFDPTYNAHVLSGSNGSVTNSGSLTYSTLLYRMIRQMYYMNYLSGSLLGSGSGWDSSLQSTAASGTLDDDYRYFPTESNANIQVLYMPRDLVGEQISPSSLRISHSYSNLHVIDDGNGNLVKVSGSERVGNVIYSQGVVIFTKTGSALMIESPNPEGIDNPLVTFQAESTIYENSVRCRVSENDFNYTLNPSANKAGSTGSYIDAVTGSDFRPYATTVGLYNSADELLVVGKLSTPYPIPSNTDLTFIIRWDS
jgi:hypothetical protein